MGFTTNFNIEFPDVDADADTWGAISNAAFQAIDDQLQIGSEAIDALQAGKVNSADPTFTGVMSGDTGNFSGIVTAARFDGPLTGNATTATALATARSFSLTGIVTAPVQAFNGSGNVALSTAIADGALPIAKTSGLQTALNAKQATLNANQILAITYGTAAPSGTPAEGAIYLQHEA